MEMLEIATIVSFHSHAHQEFIEEPDILGHMANLTSNGANTTTSAPVYRLVENSLLLTSIKERDLYSEPENKHQGRVRSPCINEILGFRIALSVPHLASDH